MQPDGCTVDSFAKRELTERRAGKIDPKRRPLRDGGGTDIVGGEQNVGLLELKTLIDSECVDIVQVNAELTGGIAHWLRIHDYTTVKSVPMSPDGSATNPYSPGDRLAKCALNRIFIVANVILRFQGKQIEGTQLCEQVGDDGVHCAAPKAPGPGIQLVADLSGE